ncbi:MAG: TIGR04255 family protein, partial [Planctomycetes bacterium]|nr:TIGR04255 family protein [Planctomycetota bacterium]
MSSEAVNANPETLPEFDDPPVVEVALSVQFESLEITPAHLGLIALAMRENGYNRIELKPPLSQVFEYFGPPPPPESKVTFEIGPPPPRHWFVNDDSSELVQLQQDRLIQNWRKVPGSKPYPRFETIRPKFEKQARDLIVFIDREQLGSF